MVVEEGGELGGFPDQTQSGCQARPEAGLGDDECYADGGDEVGDGYGELEDGSGEAPGAVA